jgi:hypothetical protein
LGANGIKSSDLDTVSTYLNKVLTSLSSDVSTTINNADSDGNSYTIKVNLGTLFSNPPQNPKKDILPAYTVSAKGTDGVNIKFNAQTYADFTFPDPTMGGLFPGMAQETLKRLLRIDENYQFELNGWVQLHPYSYNSVNPLNGALFTIVANGVTYQTPLDQWGSYDLIIRNVSSVAQPITKISLILNGTEYELQNISPNAFAGVQAKVYAYCPVSFVLPPKNLAAAKQTSPQGVFLSWNTNPSYIINYWNDGYVVQRKTGSTGYADISINSNYSNLSGVDYNITTGTQYYYRIRAFNATELSSYMYGDLYCVPKSVYYSNEVSFTP